MAGRGGERQRVAGRRGGEGRRVYGGCGGRGGEGTRAGSGSGAANRAEEAGRTAANPADEAALPPATASVTPARRGSTTSKGMERAGGVGLCVVDCTAATRPASGVARPPADPGTTTPPSTPGRVRRGGSSWRGNRGTAAVMARGVPGGPPLRGSAPGWRALHGMPAVRTPRRARARATVEKIEMDSPPLYRFR